MKKPRTAKMKDLKELWQDYYDEHLEASLERGAPHGEAEEYARAIADAGVEDYVSSYDDFYTNNTATARTRSDHLLHGWLLLAV